MAGVFAECDEACEGRDERARSADVHADEQASIVVGEAAEEYRRRNIAYHLAGQRGYEHRSVRKQPCKQRVDSLHARKIAGKGEERGKGRKQPPVHRFKRMAIEREQRRRNDDKPHGVGHGAQHHRNGEGKQQPIDCGAASVYADGGVRHAKPRARKRKAAEQYKHR